jgi:hypothetical protein
VRSTVQQSLQACSGDFMDSLLSSALSHFATRHRHGVSAYRADKIIAMDEASGWGVFMSHLVSPLKHKI